MYAPHFTSCPPQSAIWFAIRNIRGNNLTTIPLWVGNLTRLRLLYVSVLLGGRCISAIRAAPLVRVKVKFTVKNAVCYRRRLLMYDVFDSDFAFSHEWSCSEQNLMTTSEGTHARVPPDIPMRTCIGPAVTCNVTVFPWRQRHFFPSLYES